MASYLYNSTGDHRAPNALARPPNNESLEEEFTRAVQIEEHRKNVNDAKLRAVSQRVPTYDDFHQMVLGADLKPMAKKDRGKVSLLEGLSSERRGQFFGNDLYKQVAPDLGATNGVTQRSPLAEGAAAADSAGISSAPSQIPNNAMEFTREWRRSCVTASARAAYLALMPAEVEWWSGCFKVGIDVPILGQLYESWSGSFDDQIPAPHQQQAREPEPEAEPATAAAAPAGGAAQEAAAGGGSKVLAQAVAAGLLGLSSTERYELTLSLLSPAESDKLRALCRRVCDALQAEGSADALALVAKLQERYAEYLAEEEALPMAE